jgi:sugar lactone lactonase YvrE
MGMGEMPIPIRFLVALGVLGGLASTAQPQCRIPEGTPPPALRLAASGGVVPAFSQLNALSQEREPNDAPNAAMLASLGEDIDGRIDVEGDVDYYALDLEAGTQLEFSLFPAPALYNPTQWLLDTDGQTLLSSHDWESTTHRIRYTIPTTGRYYVRVGNYRPGSGSDHSYRISLRRYVAPPAGPADPVRTLHRSSSIQLFNGIAAGRTGEIFATYDDGVIRVTPSGETSTFVTGLTSQRGGGPPRSVVLDGSGNLLVTACQYPQGVVWRISPSGERSPFFLGDGTPASITIGPGGDVWFYDMDQAEIWHFDAAGTRKETIPVGYSDVVSAMAFSPSGDLHYLTGNGVIKLVDRTPVVVIPAGSMEYFSDLAFDRDGYLYVVAAPYEEGGSSSRIVLFDPEYRRILDPIAQVGDHFERSQIAGIVFARAASGEMSTRLVAVQNVQSNVLPWGLQGGIVELNPAGIRAPGWPVGDAPEFTAEDIVTALLGGKPLAPEVADLLDQRGNANGTLDVGDLRAYLRSRGQVGGSHQ